MPGPLGVGAIVSLFGVTVGRGRVCVASEPQCCILEQVHDNLGGGIDQINAPAGVLGSVCSRRYKHTTIQTQPPARAVVCGPHAASDTGEFLVESTIQRPEMPALAIHVA